MRWIYALLSPLCVSAACDDAGEVRAVGEVCIECLVGGTGGCEGQTVLACVEGAFCERNQQKCVAFSADGEPCFLDGSAFDHCAADTVCVDGLCRTVGQTGTPCTFDPTRPQGNACVDDGSCHYGAPAGPLNAGTCLPPSVEGGPCTVASLLDGRPDPRAQQGCTVGLICQPLTRATVEASGLVQASDSAACTDASRCGVAGVCVGAGVVDNGGLCVTDDTCRSGRCLVAPAPRALASASNRLGACAPGSGGDGSLAPVECLHFPWAGVCADPATRAFGDSCSDDAQCGSDGACGSDAPPTCVAFRTLPVGAPCGVDGPREALCAVGASCRFVGDGSLQCVEGE